MTGVQPRTEDEFEELMQELDADARRANVPIPLREIRALGEISHRFHIEVPPASSPLQPRDGIYDGVDLALRTSRWVKGRYGGLMTLDPRPGRMVLAIRGDLWLLHLPLLIGRHAVFCSPTEESEEITSVIDVGPPPRYNILDSVPGLPPGLRRALSQAECESLLRDFRIGMAAYLLMRDVHDQQYVTEALADHDAAVHHMIDQRRHCGLSRWGSLQAAEKMYKAALVLAGGTVEKIHALEKLATLVEQRGLPAVDRQLLQTIQCDAGVRYGEDAGQSDEALAAHHASLEVSRVLAHAIKEVVAPGKIRFRPWG